MLFKPKTLENPKDYFPYIQHTLDKDFIQEVRSFSFLPKARRMKIMDMFYGISPDNFVKDNTVPDKRTFPSESAMFNSIAMTGFTAAREIAKDPNSVAVICPRHRSLDDFILGQPSHFFHVNEDLMIAGGDNLYVLNFDKFLKNFGGFMFLRPHKKGKIFNKFSREPVMLSQREYLVHVLEEYLKQEMITGPVNHDLIVFPEFKMKEYVIGGKKINVPVSGRTKDGRVQQVSNLFPKKLASASKDSGIKVYFIGANYSLSKYPDALFLEGDSLASKLRQPFKYLFELNYVFNRYPHFAEKNDDAKVNATVTYAEPILLEGRGKGIDEKIREDMIRSEAVYPTTLVYRAMDGEDEISFTDLDFRVSALVEQYQEKGIDVSNVTDKNGKPFSGEHLALQAHGDINSNPRLFLHTSKASTRIMDLTKDSVVSNNPRIASWYGNNLKDIDELEPKQKEY
jgi:hypothetical protein